MLWNKRPTYRPEDYAIRPSARILGAMLFGFVAYLFFNAGLEAFQRPYVPPAPCRQGKGQLLCELGNWINAMTPPTLQGPLAGMGHVCAMLLLVWGIWWFLKPLFRKPKSP